MKTINNNQHYLILIIASLLVLSLLFLSSCEPEQIEPNVVVAPTECECYEYHEKKDFIQGTLTVSWVYDYTTTPIQDLCSKDNDVWVYYGGQSQWRYKTKCN